MSELQTMIEGPLGKVYICANMEGVSKVLWFPSEIQFVQKFHKGKVVRILQQAKSQIEEYLKGQRQTFDLPLSLKGTEFQKKVWSALINIPYGQVLSYQDLSMAIKLPTATRAVARANANNPINLIIPCHRVIRKSGNLSGYAGGKWRKKTLLELEKDAVRIPPVLTSASC